MGSLFSFWKDDGLVPIDYKWLEHKTFRLGEHMMNKNLKTGKTYGQFYWITYDDERVLIKFDEYPFTDNEDNRIYILKIGEMTIRCIHKVFTLKQGLFGTYQQVDYYLITTDDDREIRLKASSFHLHS